MPSQALRRRCVREESRDLGGYMKIPAWYYLDGEGSQRKNLEEHWPHPQISTICSRLQGAVNDVMIVGPSTRD